MRHTEETASDCDGAFGLYRNSLRCLRSLAMFRTVQRSWTGCGRVVSQTTTSGPVRTTCEPAHNNDV